MPSSARPVYALLILVAQVHLDDGCLDHDLALGIVHDLVDELLYLFMLFPGGAHRDDAIFRIRDDRGRLAECAATGNGYTTFFDIDRIGAVLDTALGRRLLAAGGGLDPGAGAACIAYLLHGSFAGACGQYLVGLVEDILDILGQGIPEAILGYILDGERGIVAAGAGEAPAFPVEPEPICEVLEIELSVSRVMFT